MRRYFLLFTKKKNGIQEEKLFCLKAANRLERTKKVAKQYKSGSQCNSCLT